MSNLNGVDLSNLKLAVLLACNTAQDYDISHITTNRPQNIAEKMVVCGAETVIGFTGQTWNNDCNKFALELSYRLISDGMTVDDVLYSMSDDMNSNQVKFEHSDFLDLVVVVGNGNNRLR